MNKMMTSVLAVGAGVAAFGYARKNNMITNRQMKKIQKRITKAIF
jgi:hypothetical protein